MMGNIILTSYSDKSYYVASIKMISLDKLKHQVKANFHSGRSSKRSEDFKRSTPVTRQLRRNFFSIYRIARWLRSTCEVLRHAAPFCLHSSGILSNNCCMNTYVLLHFEHKNDVKIIVKLHGATRLRLVAQMKICF